MSQWNVLVVEDEDDSMELVRGVLEYHQIESVGATNGEEAIAVLQTMALPTLIIVDLALPIIDGWGVLEFLKSNQKFAQIPRIAITAFHTPELAYEVIAAGFDAYFPKPIDSTTFVRELERIVNN